MGTRIWTIAANVQANFKLMVLVTNDFVLIQAQQSEAPYQEIQKCFPGSNLVTVDGFLLTNEQQAKSANAGWRFSSALIP